MAKETTTTYTVTVTHKGPAKSFAQLFKRRGGIKSAKVATGTSNTKDLPPEKAFSDEIKVVRAFIKKAAEKADLVYGGGGKAPLGGAGTYNIAYRNQWRFKRGEVSYNVTLRNVRIDIQFSKGLDQPGRIEIWDRTNPKKEQFQNYYGTTSSRQVHNEEIDFNLTDPEAEEQLVKIFEEWGNKYK